MNETLKVLESRRSCRNFKPDMVKDEEIERLVSEGANANQLCEAAIVAGGFDNVSVCVFSVQH